MKSRILQQIQYTQTIIFTIKKLTKIQMEKLLSLIVPVFEYTQNVSCLKQEYREPENRLCLFDQPDDWTIMLALKDWHKLQWLQLIQCQINDINVNAFAKLKWPKLILLWLYGNKVSNTGVKYLINAKLSFLKSLALGGNYIGCKGIKYITKIDLPQIQELFLDDCSIGDEGLNHLIKGKWGKLKALTLTDNKIKMMGKNCWLCAHDWKNIAAIKLSYLMSETSQAISTISLIVMKQSNPKIIFTIQNKILEKDVKFLLNGEDTQNDLCKKC